MAKKAEAAETTTPARAPETKPEPPAQAGGKGMKNKILMAVGIIVLVGASVAGGWWIGHNNGSESADKTGASTSEQVVSEATSSGESAEKKTEAEGEKGEKGEGKTESADVFFDFKKGFVINLLDPTARQVVQMSIQIEAASAEAKATIEKSEVRLRDATIMLVSSKTLAELQGTGGLERLQNELRTRYEGVLNKPNAIKDVKYSDLVFLRQ